MFSCVFLCLRGISYFFYLGLMAFFVGVTYIVAGIAVDIHLSCLVLGGGLALSHCEVWTIWKWIVVRNDIEKYCQTGEADVVVFSLGCSALLSSSHLDGLLQLA